MLLSLLRALTEVQARVPVSAVLDLIPCATAQVPPQARLSGPLLAAASQLDRAQQRAVNLVVDETKLAKLVHEMADARSGGADHLRQTALFTRIGH